MEELENKKQRLLEKYKSGTCTPEEKVLVEYIYNFSSASSADSNQKIDDELIKAEIWAKLPIHQQEKRMRRPSMRLRLWSAAAAILIVVGAGVAYFNHQVFTEPSAAASAIQIVPGSSGATLTLSDGKKIRLAQAATGELANEAGMSVIKMEDGSLVYEIKGKSGEPSKINTLATSKGETYRIKLPDGTMVWLNAASSIKYPSSFSAFAQRKVELTGEAFFEVVEDKKHPFIVKTMRQDIEVLGTHFNISAYPDEAVVKTTLLEGSVKVLALGKSKLIKPGQQLTLSESNEFAVTEVNTAMAVAWKNDEFMFDDQDIAQVMCMISRWYNVEVVYKGPRPVDRFGGSISRFDDVTKVLSLMQRTGGVNFDIRGRTIYVSK